MTNCVPILGSFNTHFAVKQAFHDYRLGKGNLSTYAGNIFILQLAFKYVNLKRTREVICESEQGQSRRGCFVCWPYLRRQRERHTPLHSVVTRFL